MVISVIPDSSRFLGGYLMLKAARNGAMSSPAKDAAVTICPAVPSVVLKVNAMSVRMNPINIPMGLVDSCDMNREGISSLFSGF